MNGRNEAVTSMVSIGAGIFAATLSLLTAGSFGAVGYLLGRQGAFSDIFGRKRSKKHLAELPIGASRAPLRMQNTKVKQFIGNTKNADTNAIIDVRIEGIRPLIPPACLLEEIPLSSKMLQTVRAL